jgi:MFS family permease
LTHQSGAARLVLDALRQPGNTQLVTALSLVASTLTIALPFSAVFLLDSLGYGFVTISALSLVNVLAYVGSLRAWGQLSDRFGNRPILAISVGMLVVALLGWSVAWGEPGPGLAVGLAALHFLTGFAVAGIELAAGNIVLKTAPPDNAPAFLAGMSATRALVAGVATVAAGAAWQAVGPGTLVVFHPANLTWSLRAFHLLALASALVGLLALLVLSRVPEPGGADVRYVARAMRREVRSLSSVAGLRAFVHVVSYAVEFVTPKSPAQPDPPPAEPGPPKNYVEPELRKPP